MLKSFMASLMVWAAFFSVFSGTTWGEPKEGLSIFGGFTEHSTSGEYTTSTYYASAGQKIDFSSSGIEVGIDYQMPAADSFSVNLFVKGSAESGDGDVSTGSVQHRAAGIQGRYWIDDNLFFGGHYARYWERYTRSGGGDASASANGFGLAAGWEKTTGLFIAAQVDRVSFAYKDSDVDTTGFNIHVGKRWK